ncbi:hypothetical protein CYMTET_49966 [Cymbomonas tetramitiformis]|uniref:Uncharacterized protein n=1 Tax=Cymbomonas tetramitiformis TaxID=36881 RepID=A0AAE0BR33_9CHLO|nr:hypothetical protein CYMTET_49966 [Cymbomonas tetramitiformis]
MLSLAGPLSPCSRQARHLPLWTPGGRRATRPEGNRGGKLSASRLKLSFSTRCSSESSDVSSLTSTSLLSREDWDARHKRRVLQEVAEAGVKLGYCKEDMYANFDVMDTLFLGFSPNMDKMKASEWAEMSMSVNKVMNNVMAIKMHFSELDVKRLLEKNPRIIMKSPSDLERDVEQVKFFLAEAKDIDALIQEVPDLLSPEVTVAVLSTFKRWWPKKDPVEALEEDPDVLRRAQEKDVPLDPVFFDGKAWNAPSHNSKGKLQSWQKYIRKEVYNEKDWDNGAYYNGNNT